MFLGSLPQRGGCAQSQGRVLAHRLPAGPSGSRPFPAQQVLGLLVGMFASKHPQKRLDKLSDPHATQVLIVPCLAWASSHWCPGGSSRSPSVSLHHMNVTVIFLLVSSLTCLYLPAVVDKGSAGPFGLPPKAPCADSQS